MQPNSKNETAPVKMPQQQPAHAILGGGKVADILLWRNKTAAASLLIGMTVIWFVFEVMEYSLVTLFCHISMATLLVAFIWCRIQIYFDRWIFLKATLASESTVREEVSSFCTTLNEVASALFERLNKVLMKLVDLAYEKDQLEYIAICLVIGNNPKLVFLRIASLYILSVIGSRFSFLDLLYFGSLCSLTLPFLYDRYKDDVDYVADKGIHELKKLFIKISDVLSKALPREPMKKND